MKRPIGLRLLDRTIIDPETGCWNWQGTKDKDGYGKMCVDAKEQRTHRLSYLYHVGPIPENHGVLHTCDNPSCTNPQHLYTGTVVENMRDKQVRRRVAGERHPYGKLKDDDVLAIRASTESQSKLAEKYGVIQAHISRIKRRVNWTHI